MIENFIRFVIATLFTFFAFIQWNDPDPILWMVNYGIAAVMSIKYISKLSFSKLIFRGTLGFIGVQAMVLAYKVIGHQHLLYAEDGREFLGLVIVLIWLFWLDIRSKQK